MTRNRVGLGFDVHPFGEQPPLVLGGVTIAGAPRLAGHSDGDAVAHAVASGARLADYQPRDRVRVMLDPAGHPFCLYLD